MDAERQDDPVDPVFESPDDEIDHLIQSSTWLVCAFRDQLRMKKRTIAMHVQVAARRASET
jgi:hypothetical protein